MVTKKRLPLTASLVLAVVMVLSGCSTASPATSTQPTPQSSAPTKTSASPASQTGAASGPAQEAVIPIGVSLSLSSPALGAPSLEIQRALQMASDQINAKGIKVGNTTYKLQMIIDDTAGDSSKAVAVLNKQLYTDNVHFLFAYSTVNGLAQQPLIDANPNVLQFVLSSSPAVLGPKHPQTVRLTQTPVEYAGAWVSWAAKNIPLVKTVYTLTSDLSGIPEQVAAFKKAFDYYGIKVVGNQDFPNTTTDFSTIIDKVIAAKPDAISYQGLPPGTTITTQLRQKGYTGPIWLQSSVGATAFKEVPNNGMEGVMSVEFDPSSPLTPGAVAQFMKDYAAKYGNDPTAYTVEFYSYAFVLASAIEQAQSTDVSKLIGVIETQQLDSPYGKIRFGGKGFYGIDRQAFTVAFVSKATGGKWVTQAAISAADMVASVEKLYGR